MPKSNSLKIICTSALVLAGAVVAGYLIYTKKTLRPLSKARSRSALDPSTWRSFEVIDSNQVTHNTRIINFKLPEDADSLGLAFASAVLVRSPVDPTKVKPYTPISIEEEIKKSRVFSLLVKDYPDGTVSKALNALRPGDLVEMKGPSPKIDLESVSQKNIGMIAGGTGLTPMLQAIKYLISHKKSVKMTLLFANHSERDILLRGVLEELERKYPDRISVHHIVTSPSQDWSSLKGHISEEAIAEALIPPPSPDTLVLVCGPPGFMETVCGKKSPDKTQGQLTGILASMNYLQDQVYKF